jgi:hypothetical protein
MIYMKTKLIVVVLLSGVGIAFASTPAARAINNHTPELPSPLCDGIQVLAGNKVAFHAYALGVQVYRWNGTSWDFVGPVANLFADANYRGKVGIHYGGPTWESNSGSNVVAARLAGCSPNSTAIPWLLLQAGSNDGPGIFDSVTYIQRVNTAGGLAPADPGSTPGEEAKIPYTAEYYFYRAEN